MLYGLPVEADEVSVDETGHIFMYGVVFTKDFGRYKQCDECHLLEIDMYIMLLTEYDEDGEIVRTTQIKLSTR